MGCGGDSGDNTFEGEGISFTYPEEWEEREAVGGGTPGAAFTTAFAPEAGVNNLIFEIGDIGSPVTESNIDAFADDLAGALEESTEGPTRLTVAGLPALRIVSHPETDSSRRITQVFDGATGYIFDCGFTSARAEEMKRGCDQAEDSFQVESRD